MGKLKFTFATTWYWLVFILLTFLTENLAHTTASPKSGLGAGSLVIMSIAAIGCLLLFFIIQHKENKMTFDWFLLPSIVILGACLLVGIWTRGDMTIPYANGSNEIVIHYTVYEKVRASVIMVIFFAVMYAMMFASRIHGMRSRTVQFILLVGICGALISLVYSLIVERTQYQLIFTADKIEKIVIYSFYGNKNYYGGVLFIGFLSCILANYYKPRFTFYVLSIVFTLAIIACGAMLPAIISFCALIIYLFEETARFAIKKRPLLTIISLFSLLAVIAGVVMFYYGSSHGWKGFVSLDIYLSELFHSKNFKTFTGRTTIWKNVLPYCFSDPMSIIFGHGFMLSETSIRGITAAMYNTTIEHGVRTTHNGYLQIMYEFGVIGVVYHIVVIGFFLYSCVRMMMEKKFHYAFINFFVALCCAAYNFCESSSFFDAGVKEMFMTQAFLMPIMVQAKFAGKAKKKQEIKDLPVSDKPLDPIKLGRSISFFILSLIVICGVTLLSSFTLQNEVLKNVMIITFVALGLSLLFVPYLVSLWYRNTDKYNFILNSIFNPLFILLSAGGVYALVVQDATFKDFALYIVAGYLFIAFLLDMIVYALIKKGSFKEWLDVFVKGSFIIPRYAIVGGVLVGGIAYLAITLLGEMNLFIFLICLLFPIMGFYGVYHFFPTKGGREIRDMFNTFNFGMIKRLDAKDEAYYG